MLNFLEQKIQRDAVIKDGNILKVDNFLNHLIDIDVLKFIGEEFKRRFENSGVTKILTIEASGISMATVTALYFHVPVLFAKKSPSVNVTGDKYTADAFSFTHKCLNHVFVAKNYLLSNDKVLIIDDFLAQGSALLALTDIVRQAGAETVGIGIAIEKGFQEGGDIIRKRGHRLESLAIVDAIDATTGTIQFREHP